VAPMNLSLTLAPMLTRQRSFGSQNVI
jgi:hypothetical protein